MDDFKVMYTTPKGDRIEETQVKENWRVDINGIAFAAPEAAEELRKCGVKIADRNHIPYEVWGYVSGSYSTVRFGRLYEYSYRIFREPDRAPLVLCKDGSWKECKGHQGDAENPSTLSFK